LSILVPDQSSGQLGDAWRFCVGAGRFELALRRDYQESLALIQREIGFGHIRQHGLLCDGVGIHQPYQYEGSRHVRHVFTYVDQVVDAYLGLGIRPFVELGYMPSGLASGDQTMFWWRGNVTPPSSLTEWAALVRATVAHLVDRYGLDEVRGWPIEVWNEPNLKELWQDADQDGYHRLYEATAYAVKEVDASLQVGGPAVSPGADEWLVRFASSRRPLRDTALAGLPVHITEFNSSYRPDNPVHDTAFHAAYLAPVLAAGGDLVDSFSYWTLSDMFEEAGVPASLFHGGFGLLTHRQIKKPSFHLYAFMARMKQQVLARGPDHLVTRDDAGQLTVLAWAPVDVTDHAGAAGGHRVRLSIPLGPGRSTSAFVLRSSVNEEAGNAWTAWREMGRPASPRPGQLDALRDAADPVRSHSRRPVVDGRVDLDLTLGRHEVTLVEVTALTDETPPWWDERRLLGLPPGDTTGP
jgi:xylan 1,4-beta-xylosidase